MAAPITTTLPRKEIMAKVFDLIADKYSMRQIAAMEGMPTKETMRKWLTEDSELAAQFARAMELRAESRSDAIDDITARLLAGELDPNQAKVASDNEKWAASKENPKKYGDRLELNGTLDVRERDAQGLESGLAIAALLIQIRDRAIADGTITPKLITSDDKPD